MENLTILSELARDTLAGLSAKPRYLLSKYFYDDKGSSIFQEIMSMPEYYLTRSEYEIFDTQKKEIVAEFTRDNHVFDLIELGPGDGLKTKVLLNSLLSVGVTFNYIPIDISAKANSELAKSLSRDLPFLKVKGQTGDFFRILKGMDQYSGNRKIILFLGSNIGNFNEEELENFFGHLSEFAHSGDMAMIGFDLKKEPGIILQAYNDAGGLTRRFNLNHLARLNRELGADFKPENFIHHSEYNPQSGEVRSFLVSRTEQSVHIEALERTFVLSRWEAILMELSRKFSTEDIEDYADRNGFRFVRQFTDRKGWFADSILIKR